MSRTAQATSHVAAAHEYCEAVMAGDIPACRWVRLAVERHLDDLHRFAPKDSPYYFDEEAAERACAIISRFPHVKGIWANRRQKLDLMPWQCFIVCVVFGWKVRADGMRRFRVAYIEVPRKNAKSTLSSGIGLLLLACDGEQGAHVVSAGTARDQAKIIFADAQEMARRTSGFRERFGVEVLAHTIVQTETASKFEAVSAEYSNLDGLNIHGALIDELHAHLTRGVWDILETATGARAQSLIWAITTAGVNKAGICYEQRSHVIHVLEKRIEDESYFGIIYTIDDDDDPFVESSWIKANPNYDISIYPDDMKAKAARAQVMPAAKNTFLTKHLNVWVNADHAWLPAGAWERLAQPELFIEKFAGLPCYVAFDLAMRSDIAATVVLFPPQEERDKWVCFGKYYLPQETIERSENAHYQGWEHAGILTVNDGATTDMDFIIDDLLLFIERFDVREIASDPWKNVPVRQALNTRGVTIPILDTRQTVAIMSPAMKELEALILDGKLVHNGDPILGWMMSNVVCHRDAKDNIYPTRETPAAKIDGVLSLLMALDRAMRNDHAARADYEKRGLWSI